MLVMCGSGLPAALAAQLAPQPAPPAAPFAQPAGVEPKPPLSAMPTCDIDFATPKGIRDTISNVLLRAERRPESEVKAFLRLDAVKRFATGDELRDAAADHFKIDRKRFDTLVEYWRHINCKHAAVPGYAVPDAVLEVAAGAALSPVPVSAFAADVTIHVVLHEMGHAVIREFDLMVLGNEETMADAFATHMLTEHFPEHAARVLSARVTSLMIEADEVPRDQWTVRGEHDSEADLVGMSERERKNARDYGSDIHRAWRRTLAPLMMPEGKHSKEARFRADEATREFVDAGDPSLRATVESVLKRIDWHSQVTVDFVGGDGGAAWSRSNRTITVNGEYLRRFITQGVKAEAAAAPAVVPPSPDTK